MLISVCQIQKICIILLNFGWVIWVSKKVATEKCSFNIHQGQNRTSLYVSPRLQRPQIKWAYTLPTRPFFLTAQNESNPYWNINKNVRTTDRPHKHSQICEVPICTTPMEANGKYCSYFYAFLARTEQLKANGHQKIVRKFFSQKFSPPCKKFLLTKFLTQISHVSYFPHGFHMDLTYFSYISHMWNVRSFPHISQMKTGLKTIYKILKYHI